MIYSIIKKTDCENCIEIFISCEKLFCEGIGHFVGIPHDFRRTVVFAWHSKWSNFDTMSTMFPDPLGIGSSASLSLAIFGEVICSLGFIVGAFYRLALIPMIFTMCIAFFVIHGADPFAVKELALVYLAIFVLMYIAGPGNYSVDRLIAKKIGGGK